MKSTFARRMSILLVLAMVLAMLPVGAMAATPTTLYLKPGVWNTANAWYSAYFFVGETSTHAAMTDTDGDGVYEVTVPEGDWTNVIFLRNDPADQVADWNGVWNQTADLEIPTDGTNMYTITGWNAGDGAWSEYVYVEPAFYVCGTMNSWTLSYADHKMVKGDDGVYSLTLTLAAGTYEFKVNDGTWNSSWGKDGGSNNIEFVLTEESNVTITFDVATKVPVVTSSALGEVETFDYYLVGSMNEWAVSSATGMTKNADGTYSITIDMVAGTYEYKANNGTWDVCFPGVGEPNATVTVATDCAVTFTLDTTAGTLVATGDGLGETPVDPDPVDPVVVTSAAVKGTIPGLTWDETDDTGVMTLVDGIYTITIPAVAASEIGADAYAFKVVANGSWDTAYPESDWTFYLNAECDVTITFNPETYEVTLAADGLTYDAPTEGGEEGGEDPVDPATNYYVTGSAELTGGAGWLANEFLMTAGENGIYTYTFTALAAGNYALKVTDGTWANNWTAASGSEYLAADGNLAFTVTAACDVTVTFDGSVVTVSGANVTAKALEELVIESVVLVGGATGESVLGNFLYGIAWDPTATGFNSLYADEGTKIYSVTYYNVEAGTYEFKFALNGGWTINYASGLAIESGVECDAWFNAQGNSSFTVAEDGTTVTFVLDLTNVTYVGDNAKMTVTIEAPMKSESSAPESLVIGDNAGFVIGNGDSNAVTSTFTATQTGTLVVTPVYMNVFDAYSNAWSEVPPMYMGMQGRAFALIANGAFGWPTVYVNVVAGETYEIGVMSWSGNAAEFTLNLAMCLEHTFETDVNAPTCEYEGYTNKYCTTCGYTETTDYVPAIGHKWTYTYSTTTHSFECGNCGATATAENTDSKKFAINSAAPVLSDDIILKYRATIPAGFEFSRMEFLFNDEVYTYYDYVMDGERIAISFPYIIPQKMGDNISATLYAYVDGVEVSVKIASYSMLKYCDNQLKKTNLSDTLRALYSDVLAYGASVQIMMNYKTDDLVTGKVTNPDSLKPSTFPGLDSSYNLMKRTGTALDNLEVSGVTVMLGSKVNLRYTIKTTDLESFTYKVQIKSREYTFTGADLVPTSTADTYYLYFDGAMANELGEKITLTCWDGDTQVSRTIEYSVYTYVYRNYANSSKTEAERNLLMALFNYGESTKNAVS